MAIALTKIQLTSGQSFGTTTPVYRLDCTVNLDNPYAAGGIALAPADVTAAAALATCTTIQNIVFDSTCLDGTHYFTWNSGTAKVQAFVHATGAEAGAVDLSAAAKHSRCTVTFI